MAKATKKATKKEETTTKVTIKAKPAKKEEKFDPKLIRMCVDVFPPEDEMERFAELARQEEATNVIAGLGQSFCAGVVFPQRIAFITAKKWATGRTLAVAFLGGSIQQQEFTAKTADKLSQFANIKFQWGVQASQSDLRVAYAANEGAYSYLGTDNLGIPKNRKTLNLGWLDEAVVLHEFCHALGAIHEHQHPESAIPWNKNAVYAYYGGPPNNWDQATINSNIFGAYSRESTQFSAYDRTSIMHYSLDGRLLTDPSRAVGWNSVLSASDKDYLGKLYPFATQPPPPVDPADPENAISYIAAFNKNGKELRRWK